MRQNHLRKSLFYNLIFCLSCFDVVTIISFGTKKVLEAFVSEIDGRLINIFETFGLIGSIYSTVAISLERYLGVCHENSKLRRKLLIYIVPVLLLASTLTIPDVVDFYNSMIQDKEFSRLEGEDWIFFEAFGIRMIIPTLLLIILNGAVFLRIRKARLLLSAHMQEHQRRRSQTIRILFLIVFVFIVCSVLPRLTLRIVARFAPEVKDWMKPITSLLIITNSSVNIFIYCYVGTDFRRNTMETVSQRISTILLQSFVT